MKGFKVQSIRYSFFFDAINDIQQRYMKNSEILERINFKNPMVYPDVANMPVEAPVVIIKHESMDIQLIIQHESLSIAARFTEGFEELPDSCVLTICDFIETIMDKSNINFVECEIGSILEEDSVIGFLKNNLLKNNLLEIKNGLHKIDISYTSVIENRFFLDTKIANKWMFNQPINIRVSGVLKEEHKNVMLLNIAVNNRYAFDIGEKSTYDLKTEIKRIKQIAYESFNETSSKLIKD